MGEGVRQDLAAAIDMYKSAVEFGCDAAQKDLDRLVTKHQDKEMEDDRSG